MTSQGCSFVSPDGTCIIGGGIADSASRSCTGMRLLILALDPFLMLQQAAPRNAPHVIIPSLILVRQQVLRLSALVAFRDLFLSGDGVSLSVLVGPS